jgi:hypothetical protein
MFEQEAYMHSMRDLNMTGSHLMSHAGWTLKGSRDNP